jgi:hypothetical protein
MTDSDRMTGYELIKTATLVNFDIIEKKAQTSPDGEETCVRIEMLLGEEEEDGERTEDVEWGAFGFIFALAVLSFHDARPRGVSDMHYEDKDEFTVADFIENLRYERGELRFTSDYLRGRCMKTDVTVRPNGSVTLTTRNRGESALRWVDRLKGKNFLQVVS